MTELEIIINKHKEEISKYLSFSIFITNSLYSQNSCLKQENTEYKLDTTLVNTMYSTIYIMLYNSIESVITKIFEYLSQEICSQQKKITHFEERIQKSWLEYILQLKESNMSPESRLQKAITILHHFQTEKPIELIIQKANSGNLDDDTIQSIFKKLGINLKLSKGLKQNLKFLDKVECYPNGQSCLKEIKVKRNELGHGDITFAECGKTLTIQKLEALTKTVFQYIDEILSNFSTYINNQEYLAKC